MKFSSSVYALALAVAVTAQYRYESPPFNLYLLSDSDYNGSTLSACHTGAAMESLCVSNGSSVSKPTPIAAGVFHFNTTGPDRSLLSEGYITYLLRGSNFNLSQPLGLSINPISNVALPMFQPGEEFSQTFWFDENGLLDIQGYIDDRVDGDPVAVGPTYRWHACTTYYGGYVYQTLAWVLGEGPPQNPTCVKVDVKRVFV